MGQILRQARAAGLKTQFMGPEGVANVSLSNIAGESAEGLLVTKPKNYDQVPANKPIVDAIKAKKTGSKWRVLSGLHLRRAAIFAGGPESVLTIRLKSPNT